MFCSLRYRRIVVHGSGPHSIGPMEVARDPGLDARSQVSLGTGAFDQLVEERSGSDAEGNADRNDPSGVRRLLGPVNDGLVDEVDAVGDKAEADEWGEGEDTLQVGALGAEEEQGGERDAVE